MDKMYSKHFENDIEEVVNKAEVSQLSMFPEMRKQWRKVIHLQEKYNLDNSRFITSKVQLW